MPEASGPTPDERRLRANELIAYHSPISHRLTSERTSYQSQLIPVTPYILVACGETFVRYPEMMRTIDAAMPAEQIGASGRRPGTQVNTVYLWSIANFFLVGRKVFTQFDPSLDSTDAAYTVLDFWDRAARGFRGDGTRQAVDAGGVVHAYDRDVVRQLAESAVAVDEELRPQLQRFNATLVNYLFLLYFDTRVGSGDTGPYDLGALGLGPAGRTMIVRDFYRMGPSDFWWSDVAADVPYQHLVAGLVLEDVSVSITDFGTSNTDPEDYLDRLVGFSLFTTDGEPPGSMRPVPLDEIDGIMAACRAGGAQPLPAHRRHGRGRDDPLRGLRVLHLPEAVRRGRRRGRPAGLDRAPGRATTGVRPPRGGRDRAGLATAARGIARGVLPAPGLNAGQEPVRRVNAPLPPAEFCRTAPVVHRRSPCRWPARGLRFTSARQTPGRGGPDP